MDFEQLNIWGWIILSLQLLGLWASPFVWGKDRGKIGMTFLISNILGLILTILALRII